MADVETDAGPCLHCGAYGGAHDAGCSVAGDDSGEVCESCGGSDENIQGCASCCRDCGRPCSFEKDGEGFHACEADHCPDCGGCPDNEGCEVDCIRYEGDE